MSGICREEYNEIKNSEECIIIDNEINKLNPLFNNSADDINHLVKTFQSNPTIAVATPIEKLDSTPVDGNIDQAGSENWWSIKGEIGYKYKIIRLNAKNVDSLRCNSFEKKNGTWNDIGNTNWLDSNGTYLEIKPSVDGEIKICLSSTNTLQYGTYQICIIELPAEPDPAVSSTVSITKLNSSPIDGNITPLGDEDWWSFEGKTGYRYKIIRLNAKNMNSLRCVAYEELFSGWKEIGSNNWLDSNGAYLEISPSIDGEIKVMIRSTSILQSGSYQFGVIELPGEPDPAISATVAITQLDSSPTDGKITPAGDEDWWSFEGKTGYRYKIIRLNTKNIDSLRCVAYEKLFSGWKEIGSNNWLDSNGVYLEISPSIDGEIKVMIRSTSILQSGTYQIGVIELPAEPEPAVSSTVSIIKLNSSPTDGNITPIGDEDWWSFEGKTGYRYKIIRLNAKNMASLRCVAYEKQFSGWKEIGSNNWLDSNGAYLEISPSIDGDIKVMIRSTSILQSGNYQFGVIELPGEPDPAISATIAITQLDSSPNDGKITPAGDEDWWSFEGKTGYRYKIIRFNTKNMDSLRCVAYEKQFSGWKEIGSENWLNSDGTKLEISPSVDGEIKIMIRSTYILQTGSYQIGIQGYVGEISFTPTPTQPTPIITVSPTPTVTPEINIPTSTPTIPESTPTPTVKPSDPNRIIFAATLIKTLECDKDDLSACGWMEIPGGFDALKSGKVSPQQLEANLIPSSKDLKGLLFELTPNAVSMLMGLESVSVTGEQQILMRAYIRSMGKNAQVVLGALKGEFITAQDVDGTLGMNLIKSSSTFVDKEGVISILFKPDSGELITPFIQASGSGPGIYNEKVWLDRIEIYRYEQEQ